MYKTIIAWHRFTNSHHEYIDRQVQKAKEDNAPEDAIYRKANGKWATINEIENRHALRFIINFLIN